MVSGTWPPRLGDREGDGEAVAKSEREKNVKIGRAEDECGGAGCWCERKATLRDRFTCLCVCAAYMPTAQRLCRRACTSCRCRYNKIGFTCVVWCCILSNYLFGKQVLSWSALSRWMHAQCQEHSHFPDLGLSIEKAVMELFQIKQEK